MLRAEMVKLLPNLKAANPCLRFLPRQSKRSQPSLQVSLLYAGPCILLARLQQTSGLACLSMEKQQGTCLAVRSRCVHVVFTVDATS